MTDNKIVDLDSFRIKKKKKKSNQKDMIQICELTMYDIINNLDAEGFDVKDPDLLYDLEIISGLIIAAVSRQANVKSENIKELISILDELRGDDV